MTGGTLHRDLPYFVSYVTAAKREGVSRAVQLNPRRESRTAREVHSQTKAYVKHCKWYSAITKDDKWMRGALVCSPLGAWDNKQEQRVVNAGLATLLS
jgi:hypothetical protein